MRSLILSTAMQLLLPLMLLFSLFLLFRGHNEPGGGFVGGLVASAGFTLYALAFGKDRARRLLHIDPRRLIGVGLLVAAGSGLVAFFGGEPFMTGIWGGVSIPVIGKFGTPIVFDAGVYLTVVGVTLLIVYSLLEE